MNVTSRKEKLSVLSALEGCDSIGSFGRERSNNLLVKQILWTRTKCNKKES